MARLSIVTTSRWPRLPAWVILVTSAWLVLVGATVFLGRAADDPFVTCNFRRVTGVPCPTCGTTRAVLATCDGDLLAAAAWNPLICAAGLVALVLLVLRVGFRRAVSATLTRTERRATWLTAIALVAANWAYLIWSQT